MNNWKLNYSIDLCRSGRVVPVLLPNTFVVGDDQAHEWNVAVYNAGVAVDLSGYTIMAYITRFDGKTVLLSGNATDNVATVTLSDACYAVSGVCTGILRISKAGGEKVTISAIRFAVGLMTSDEIVDPGHVIPSLNELLEQIEAMEAATENANAAANQSVRFDAAQTLTAEQQMQALNNIGGASHTHLLQLENLVQILIMNANNWTSIREVVRQGMGPNLFPIGTQFRVNHSVYGEIVFDVTAHDQHSDPDGQQMHSMTLQMHDVIYNRQMDAAEALYYCAADLAAGTYHFTLMADYDTAYGGGKTLQFTTTVAVPAGGVVMFPWKYQTQSTAAKISTYESQTAATALESVIVTEGSGGISLGTADGNTENMNHIHRIRYGSNNWAESAARQWLNSDAAAGDWWTPQTIFDRPPTYAGDAGFLHGFDTDFVAALGAVDILTAENTVYEAGNDVGGSYTTRDRVFPPSTTEIGLGNNNGIAEGSVMPYYVGATQTDRIKYDITNANIARYWWLRSPVSSYASHVRYVYSSGALNGNFANNGVGLAAACVIF